jgi:hypothetical protein
MISRMRTEGPQYVQSPLSLCLRVFLGPKAIVSFPQHDVHYHLPLLHLPSLLPDDMSHLFELWSEA